MDPHYAFLLLRLPIFQERYDSPPKKIPGKIRSLGKFQKVRIDTLKPSRKAILKA